MALLLQVIAAVILLFKQTFLAPSEYEVWEVMGTLKLTDGNDAIESTMISILPRPEVNENGQFSFFVVANRKGKNYILPDLRFENLARQQEKVLPLDPKWDAYSDDAKENTAI